MSSYRKTASIVYLILISSIGVFCSCESEEANREKQRAISKVKDTRICSLNHEYWKDWCQRYLEVNSQSSKRKTDRELLAEFIVSQKIEDVDGWIENLGLRAVEDKYPGGVSSVIGWRAKRTSDYDYEVSYAFIANGTEHGWYFEVSLGGGPVRVPREAYQ